MRFKTVTKVSTRFSDTDTMGHVNNAQFFSFMEEARVAYFSQITEFNFLGKEPPWGMSIILAEISCSFKSPVFFGETILVAIGVTSVGNSSFVMEYEMQEEKTGRLVATGRSVQVCYDYQAKKSCPLTAAIKRRFVELDSK